MRIWAVGVSLVLAMALGVAVGQNFRPAAEPQALATAPPETPPPLVVPAAPATFGQGEEATIALFERARGSVVAISTAADRVNPWNGRRATEALGTGSGFLWDDAGHVVTNNHVIDGASTITVLLSDGRSFAATLVGRDPRHDVAVLQIAGEDLPPPLPLGDSATLRVGQSVMAIGNPFGLDWTLTTGIVSALDRELPGGGPGNGGLIQTDAAINPGNSGGPLLDSQGRVIGMNSAIFSPSGANAGIGFAVPVGTVGRVVPQLIATGHFAPPSLGIVWDARINAAVNRMGLQGVMVLDVTAGTDAARAGLEPARMSRDGRIVPGHVLTAIDGEPVATVDDMLAALDTHQPGDQVEVTFDKGGDRQTATLALVADEGSAI